MATPTAMAMLIVLSVSTPSNIAADGKTHLVIEAGDRTMTWDECWETATGINTTSGEVGAVCYPVTTRELNAITQGL